MGNEERHDMGLELAIDILKKAADESVKRSESLNLAYDVARRATQDREAMDQITASIYLQGDVFSQCTRAVQVLEDYVAAINKAGE